MNSKEELGSISSFGRNDLIPLCDSVDTIVEYLESIRGKYDGKIGEWVSNLYYTLYGTQTQLNEFRKEYEKIDRSIDEYIAELNFSAGLKTH